jgi:hypothetical protein
MNLGELAIELNNISIQDMNNMIKSQISEDIIKQLTDEQLIEEYKQCKSVKNEIFKLSTILTKHVSDEIVDKIISEYIINLIPPGTKGVIRGNKFNSIIKTFILSLNMDATIYEICFEANCLKHITSEIPDWYITHIESGKTLIGMNQLDLWGGGHQLNRGFKYISQNKDNNMKIVCVVCNDVVIKSMKNKIYKLFETGFQNDTLCYIGGLQKIILDYFA